MNFRFPLLVTALLIFSGSASDLAAQIRDDEQSTNYLAVQCAMSSGGDSASYEEYGRKLAKTVALLSAGQQERVFGYVPRPITFARPEDPEQSNGEYGGMAANTPESDSQSASTAGSPVGNGQSSDEDVPPVAGASAQESESLDEKLTDESFSEELEEEKSGNDWWGGFMDWLDGLLQSIVDDIALKQQSAK
ncbi:MAG: hypothetical protein P1U58_06555 [Verrucomicrobiales bacterium]|nr:hypothetical protein [Verrucomicrobiales bacterium]